MVGLVTADSKVRLLGDGSVPGVLFVHFGPQNLPPLLIQFPHLHIERGLIAFS